MSNNHMASPSHEPGQSPQDPLLSSIQNRFTEAYQLQMGKDSPIGLSEGHCGTIETIALNPKGVRDSNNRYLLCGPSLSFSGLSWNTGSNEFDVAYLIVNIPLAEGDERPISELQPDDLVFSSQLMVSDEGEVYDLSIPFSLDELKSLTDSISGCEVSPILPDWAQVSDE